MAVYLTNEEAGFLDRSPEQLEILVYWNKNKKNDYEKTRAAFSIFKEGFKI